MIGRTLRRAWQLLGLLARIYLPCLIAAPLILIAIDRFVGINANPINPFADWLTLLLWSALEFGCALIIGLPLALTISRRVQSYWMRTLLITLGGGAIVLVAFGIISGGNPLVIFGLPAGMLVALSCCLFNADRLRQPQPPLFYR